MKIVDVNYLTGVLKIKFASDTAQKPIDDYPEHEIQVLELDDMVTVDVAMNAIAQTGWNIALQQENQENIIKNNSRLKEYADLVSKVQTFSFSDLNGFSEGTASDIQPSIQGLMIV